MITYELRIARERASIGLVLPRLRRKPDARSPGHPSTSQTCTCVVRVFVYEYVPVVSYLSMYGGMTMRVALEDQLDI